MTQAVARAPSDILSRWCGWVVVGGLAVTPLLGWLGPMGFAILLSAIGLLCLPALGVEDQDRPVLAVLFIGLIWAGASTIWSPFHPTKLATNTALKLALELPLYWSAVCGAKRADPKLKRAALVTLAWAAALFGTLLLVEFATDAQVYEQLHLRFYGPIRHDISEVKIAHSSFVLALLTPAAIAAAVRVRLSPWIGLPMVLGTICAALRFQAEAPALAMLVAAVAALVAWRWPKGGPIALGLGAAAYFLAAPLVVLGARAAGVYEPFQRSVELSWSMRMDFWRHAVQWIGDHPLRGWGLDASRMFGPGIILHPHDDALQLWLELGFVGAILAAAFWFLSLRRLSRPAPDAAAIGLCGSAAVYLLFGALNFGVWQEWWLGLGALIALIGALFSEAERPQRST